MGWFSPIKGHYPSLGQIDKTLPVKAGNETIERGMVLAMVADSVSDDGVFKIAGVSGDAITADSMLYIALQDYRDAQAGMAGTTGFDGASADLTGVTAGVPTITGLSLDMEGEYETDQYDADSFSTGDGVGTKLTVKSGLLSKAGNTDVVVGYLAAPINTRWVNNAIAKPVGVTDPRLATRQGKTVSVIRFRTK